MGNKPIPAKLERAPLEEVKKPKFFDKMMRFFEFVFTIANYLGRFSRKYKVGEAVKDFMHHNKDLLIIVCDPQNDTIMTGYKDYMTGTVMKPQPGKKRAKVIKGVMGLSRQEENIDRFLLQIDGAVFNIAKAIRDGRRDGNGKTDGVGPVKVINNQIANA